MPSVVTSPSRMAKLRKKCEKGRVLPKIAGRKQKMQFAFRFFFVTLQPKRANNLSIDTNNQYNEEIVSYGPDGADDYRRQCTARD